MPQLSEKGDPQALYMPGQILRVQNFQTVGSWGWQGCQP
jgi:hypothetical protein